MKVTIAAHCGFCTGVRRAVERAMSVPAENTYVLGELIHNEEVTARIAARGIPTVESLDEVPDGATLLIRSHGVGRAVYEECERKNIRVEDCTCTFVRNEGDTEEGDSASARRVRVEDVVWHPVIEHWENDKDAVYLVEDYTEEQARANELLADIDDPYQWIADTTHQVIGDEFTIKM